MCNEKVDFKTFYEKIFTDKGLSFSKINLSEMDVSWDKAKLHHLIR